MSLPIRESLAVEAREAVERMRAFVDRARYIERELIRCRASDLEQIAQYSPLLEITDAELGEALGDPELVAALRRRWPVLLTATNQSTPVAHQAAAT